MMQQQDAETQINQGDRFGFGENWSRFLKLLTEDRIKQAEESLQKMLELDHMKGKSFLDIGSGSGLFSLAARRLGADVQSFDFDPKSVACTAELRRRYFPNDNSWLIEKGSILDEKYVLSLGLKDIVYSWGVLHHTGDMWTALNNAALPVKPNGLLFIAIYNDQGAMSRIWLRLKKIYNKLPGFLRGPYALLIMLPRELLTMLWMAITGKIDKYFSTWIDKDTTRGMDRWRDIIDWIGGLPFEVATPEQIFEFYKARGFNLLAMKTCRGGLGCNEFVFERTRVQQHEKV